MEQTSSASTEQNTSSADQLRLQQFAEQLKAQQSVGLGLAAGIVAGLLGAALWAGITVATKYQIGWIAIGVGFLVGFAVRLAGKGVDKRFGVMGGVIALVACVLGNFFSICGFIAIEQDMGFFEVLARMTGELAVDLMKETFSPMDLVFYALATWAGFSYSFRKVEEADVQQALNR